MNGLAAASGGGDSTRNRLVSVEIVAHVFETKAAELFGDESGKQRSSLKVIHENIEDEKSGKAGYFTELSRTFHAYKVTMNNFMVPIEEKYLQGHIYFRGCQPFHSNESFLYYNSQQGTLCRHNKNELNI
ncbi:hypothetical protein WA026_003834 [Henosepilachna vigintioctopunctata]|uniref:Uncharacterized protein n=1 Tax=Henosepilachna vigintioctopunctata TaxID=420089 RepID=A0AAW1UE47_9CUCU